MHILHSLPAALIRRGNIDPVHKIMQHSGRQFLQVGVFLRPEDELLNAVGFFLLPATTRTVGITSSNTKTRLDIQTLNDLSRKMKHRK